MRFSIQLVLGLFVLLAVNSAYAEELTAKAIIDKSLEQNAMGFKSGQAQMSLKIQDKNGNSRERKLDVKSKTVSELARTRVELLAPKEVQGQAFLFAEREGEDDVWMYLPAFKVTRRIEGGQKNGAFLGSHFTYADLESRDMKDGEYKRLADEKIGKNDVYVVESTPKKGASSDYSRVVTYIRKSDFIPLKVKFYARKADPVKTLFVEKLAKTKAGQTYASRMTLRAADGGFTTMEIGALAEREIADSEFSKDQLGK